MYFMANREEERKQKRSRLLDFLSLGSDSSSHTRLHESNLWGSPDFPEALGLGGNQGDSLEIGGDRRLEGERPSVSLGAGAPCVPSQETTSIMKQPRLGRCDGLVNYEKKKVDPNVFGNKDCAPCVTSKFPSQGTTLKRLVKEKKKVGSEVCGNKVGAVISDSNIDPRFARDAAFSDCAFPMPPPVACRSTLDHSSSAIERFLLLKDPIIKMPERTISDIDLFEDELKLQKSDSGVGYPCPAMPVSAQDEENAKPCSLPGSTFNTFFRPPPLLVDTCAVAEGIIDGPGTAIHSLDSISLVKRSNLSVELNATKVFASNQEDAVVSSCMEKRLPLQNINHGAPVSSNLHVLADQEQTYKAILAENIISSRKASEVFQKLMPSKECDLRDVDSVIKSILANLESSMNDPVIRARFAKRQRFLRFKEKVMVIKFRALRHCWKNSKTTRSRYIKPRASASSAGNPNTVVPDSETIKFVRKLLLNPNVQPCRDFLKMPSMILDKNLPRFISSNGLVEDPVSVEKERLMINPWTAEEREIFMDKLSVFKDNFARIAAFLDHKTTADCVEFYYKNCYPGKQNTPFSCYWYLAVSGKRWIREAFGSQHMYSVDDDLLENLRLTEFDISGNEVETEGILKLLLDVLERDLEISVGFSLPKLGNGLGLLNLMNPETENVGISAH